MMVTFDTSSVAKGCVDATGRDLTIRTGRITPRSEGQHEPASLTYEPTDGDPLSCIDTGRHGHMYHRNRRRYTFRHQVIGTSTPETSTKIHPATRLPMITAA